MLKFLLYPISKIWALVMLIRRCFYAKRGRFVPNVSTICVGNLCVGGTGKTPHVEYLIRLLSKDYNVATLSRGYGRQTQGFLFADNNTTVEQLGDEPLSYYKKYPQISVAVSENRLKGIQKVMATIPDTDVILLDDAYQHLPLKSGLTILLTDYYNLYTKDYVLPMGTLREGKSAAKEADIIVVTKSPKAISVIDEDLVCSRIAPLPHQKIYFSYIDFASMCPITAVAATVKPETIKSVVVLTAIANPYPLFDYVKSRYSEIQYLTFQDHHQFTSKDVLKAKALLERSLARNRAILTTEKDAVRLCSASLVDVVKDLPIFFVPIEVKFQEKYKTNFENNVLEYVRKNK